MLLGGGLVFVYGRRHTCAGILCTLLALLCEFGPDYLFLRAIPKSPPDSEDDDTPSGLVESIAIKQYRTLCNVHVLSR